MFEQVKLSYGYGDLAPMLDAATIETHYAKHHAAYTKNFNDLVAQVPELAGKSAEEILSNLDQVPVQFRTAIRNQGGGYLNHNQYFSGLSPSEEAPSGALLEQINRDFEGYDHMRDQMSKAAAGQFGSGWAWLIADPKGTLSICTSSNQDTPVNEGLTGIILALDVWEHAYYLGYRNLRADYIAAYWKIVDWNEASRRFEAAKNI